MSGIDSAEALARIPGFYPTPPTVVAMLIERAGPWTRGDLALEPSAGRGDIADRLRDRVDRLVVVEPNPTLVQLLMQKGYAPVPLAFEDYGSPEPFDKIVMNPPFAHGLDMLHVRRAFDMLAPDGVLAALMNDGDDPHDGSPEQRAAFALWLTSEPAMAEARFERLDPQFFLSSENFRPSHVPVRLVRLRKRCNIGCH